MARIHDITKIPIVALVALKPYMELTDKNFGRIENEEYYLYFKGLKTTESCFFGVQMHEVKNNTVAFLITMQPTSIIDPNKTDRWMNEASLKVNFEIWTKLLETYQEMSSLFQTDKKEKQFTDEFFQEFTFVDDEDAESGFSLNQIIELDKRLDAFKIKLLEEASTFLPEALNEIQNEIEITQDGLVNNSKRWFAMQLSKIQAKILKQGPRFLKETGVEFLKSVVFEYINTKMLRM